MLMDDILMDLLNNGSCLVGLVDSTFLSVKFFSSLIQLLDNSLLLMSHNHRCLIDLFNDCFSSTIVLATRHKLLLLLILLLLLHVHVWRTSSLCSIISCSMNMDLLSTWRNLCLHELRILRLSILKILRLRILRILQHSGASLKATLSSSELSKWLVITSLPAGRSLQEACWGSALDISSCGRALHHSGWWSLIHELSTLNTALANTDLSLDVSDIIFNFLGKCLLAG